MKNLDIGTNVKHWLIVGKISNGIFTCLCTKCELTKIDINRYRLLSDKHSFMCKMCSLKLKSTSHGMHKTRCYKIWGSMKSRCKTNYFYTKLGITYCESWELFENFYRDMGDPPSSKHTLDRIDCAGPYSKDNCRWATKAQQAYNTRPRDGRKYKGTRLLPSGRWSSSITYNGKCMHIGVYNSEEGAALAYNEKAKELFGEFAHLNCVN